MKKINAMIKDFVEEKNLTAKDFASMIQGSEDTVKNWLYKDITPSKELVKTIGNVIDIDFSTMRQLWLDAMLPLEDIWADDKFLLPDDKYREDVLTALERNIDNKFTSDEKLAFGYCWILAKVFFANEASLFIIDEILNDTDKNGRTLIRKLRDNYDFPILNEIFNFFMNDYYTGISGVRGATTTYNNCSNLRNTIKLTLFDVKIKSITKKIALAKEIDTIKDKYTKFIEEKEMNNIIQDEELKNIILSLCVNKYNKRLSSADVLLLSNYEEFKKFYAILKTDEGYTLYHMPNSKCHDIDLNQYSLDSIREKAEQLKEQIEQVDPDKFVDVKIVEDNINDVLKDKNFVNSLTEDEYKILLRFMQEKNRII